MNKPKISIIWDFDKTLTPHDSATELIRVFIGNKTKEFWGGVKKISGVDSKIPVDSISTSEAPVWMYLLSEMTESSEGDKIALDEIYLRKMVAAHKIIDGIHSNK